MIAIYGHQKLRHVIMGQCNPGHKETFSPHKEDLVGWWSTLPMKLCSLHPCRFSKMAWWSPELPGLTSELMLLSAEGWSRHLPRLFTTLRTPPEESSHYDHPLLPRFFKPLPQTPPAELSQQLLCPQVQGLHSSPQVPVRGETGSISRSKIIILWRNLEAWQPQTLLVQDTEAKRTHSWGPCQGVLQPGQAQAFVRRAVAISEQHVCTCRKSIQESQRSGCSHATSWASGT